MNRCKWDVYIIPHAEGSWAITEEEQKECKSTVWGGKNKTVLQDGILGEMNARESNYV